MTWSCVTWSRAYGDVVSLLPAEIAPLIYLAITLTAILNPVIPLVLFVAYGLYWILPLSRGTEPHDADSRKAA
jgi:hypothetical protein